MFRHVAARFMSHTVTTHIHFQTCFSPPHQNETSYYLFCGRFGSHNLNSKKPHLTYCVSFNGKFCGDVMSCYCNTLLDLCGLSSPRSDSCLGLLRSGMCAVFTEIFFFCLSWRFFSAMKDFSLLPSGFLGSWPGTSSSQKVPCVLSDGTHSE